MNKETKNLFPDFQGTCTEWELTKNTSFSGGSFRKGHVICMRQNGQLMSFAGTWTPYNCMTDQEELANAHLIAAAPDLLYALLRIIKDGKLSVSNEQQAIEALDMALNFQQ